MQYLLCAQVAIARVYSIASIDCFNTCKISFFCRIVHVCNDSRISGMRAQQPSLLHSRNVPPSRRSERDGARSCVLRMRLPPRKCSAPRPHAIKSRVKTFCACAPVPVTYASVLQYKISCNCGYPKLSGAHIVRLSRMQMKCHNILPQIWLKMPGSQSSRDILLLTRLKNA